MNKKFLSAILFGALMVTSTGTFVSCKDYDDDIDQINSTLNDLKSQLAALQTEVNNGDYVTGVSKTADGKGMVFTFSKGNAVTVTLDVKDGVNGEAGTPGTPGKDGTIVTINSETGELLIDGKATGFFTTKEKEAKKESIKIEGGFWHLLNEKGEYENTNIPVSGISVSGTEADGWTLTVVDSEGQSQTVKLPTAASSITGIKLADNEDVFKYAFQKFTLEGKTENAIKKASDWNGKKGTKNLPNNGDFVYSSSTQLDVRIDPITVNATTIPFYLTDTKNADLKPVQLYAVNAVNEGDEPLTSGNINGRSVSGNGLYTLGMANVVVAKNSNDGIAESLTKAVDNKYVYAVNAGHAFRSLYGLIIENEEAPQLSQIKLEQYAVTPHVSDAINIPTTTATATATATKKYEVGTPIYVSGIEHSGLYDMHLEADKSDVDVYGLVFDQKNRSVTIGKNPDVSSVEAYFTLIVWTVDNEGNIKKTSVKVNIDTQLVVPEGYNLIEHGVNKAAANNFFGIDLAIMKQGLGDKLNAWMQNVDLTAANITYQWFSNEALTAEITPADGLFKYDIVKELKKESDAAATTDRNNANFIRVIVTNPGSTSVAKYIKADNTEGNFVLGKTYYVKVTFQTKGTTPSVLNSIVVPVKFTAPALAKLFAPKEGYVVENVINAYYYGGVGDKNIELKEFFKVDNYVADAVVAFEGDTKIGETDKTSDKLGTVVDGSTNFGNTKVTLDDANKKKDENGVKQLELGYGEALIMNVSKDNYAGWRYDSDTNDSKYQFKIRIQSPIFEGTVKPVTGKTIEISANETVGFDITSEMIKGYDYNKNEYDVVPDVVPDEETETDIWSNNGVVLVTGTPDTQNYVKDIEVKKATKPAADKPLVKGVINVIAKSVSNDTPVNIYINVKDAWGYVKTVPVSVTIKKN